MKRMMTAALMLSLLGGTSALAQEIPGDPGERRAEARERVAARRAVRVEQKEERAEAKAEAKQERREDKAEVREQRQQRRVEHLATTPPRRSERAEEVLAQVRARNAERAEVRQDRREDRREDRRDDRRDGQRVIIGPDRDRTERTVRPQVTQERSTSFRRPGEGHRLRDRDRNRSWYDASRYRRTYRATHRYRLPTRYIYPSGWYVRSWAFGDRLPHSSWYSNRYYLDWWRYGLPRPPIGTEWVRMRDNAILVDVWSGRVLAVYYDLFW
jgi:hypothetical protein